MNEPAKSSIGAVLLTWLIVLVPAGWGVTQTVKKSLPLFSAFGSGTPAAATSNPATTTSAAPTTSP